MDNDSKPTVSRRKFLTTAAGAAVGAGLMVSLPGRQVLGANDRIRVGLIGCGGMGSSHLSTVMDMGAKGDENCEMVAVCDIFEPRKQYGAAQCKGKAIHDYRDLLEMKDVDAVFIATPDHWHSRMTIDAFEAGKDVYCEKPMTLHWEEAKQVYEAQRRTGRVLQVGSQGTSESKWPKANELIRAGAIGKIVWSQTSICRNSKDGEWNYYGIDHNSSPQNLDWDRFLGPAPKRPFDPERFFRWRKYWDYSGGTATDLISHVLHALLLALGPEFPLRVVSGGTSVIHQDREVPETFHVIVDYPTGHSVVVCTSMENEQGLPVVIHGHEATMYLSGGDIEIRPEKLFAEEREQQTVHVEGVDAFREHHLDFFRCMRSREKPRCHAELAYKTCCVLDLSCLSYRENQVKLFDPVKQEVIQ